MPALVRQYLTSQGCLGCSAARRRAGSDAAKGAANLLRWLGLRVSRAIAYNGTPG